MSGTLPTAAGATQPEAVLPQDPRPKRAVSRSAPTNTPHQGDLICGECGEGNAPTRRFCSRCGASLATAQPVRIRWWRRLLPNRGAKRAGGASGTADGTPGAAKKKRKSGGAMARVVQSLRRVVAVVVLLGGIAYATFAPLRTFVNDEVGALTQKAEAIVHPQYAPAHPIEATANAESKGHPAGAAIDGFTNTYWAAPASGPEQVLVLRFDHSVDLAKALIRVGVSGNFGATNRPHAVHAVYSTGHSQDLTLDDSAEPQELTLKPGGAVTSVELHVTSFYRAVNSTEIAITEVELFARK